MRIPKVARRALSPIAVTVGRVGSAAEGMRGLNYVTRPIKGLPDGACYFRRPGRITMDADGVNRRLDGRAIKRSDSPACQGHCLRRHINRVFTHRPKELPITQ